MSNYTWGWAPFHYGRWIRDSYHGWVWIPGYEWGPAWVQWRYSNDYIGWAPLPPGVRFEMHIGYDNRDYGVHYSYWSYINCRDFNSHNYQFISGNRIEQIHRQTRNITNIGMSGRNVYNYGPSVTDIERATRSRITQYSIVDDNRTTSRNNQRIENNNVYIYRPTIERPVTSTRDNNQPNRSEQTSRGQIEQGRQTNQTINQVPNINNNEPNRSRVTDTRSNTSTNNRTSTPQNNRTETPTIINTETSSGRNVNQTPNTNRSSQDQNSRNNEANRNSNETQRTR